MVGQCGLQQSISWTFLVALNDFHSQNSASLKFYEPEYETMSFSEESTLPLTKKLIKKSPERGAKI
jgi:hypothetical protein